MVIPPQALMALKVAGHWYGHVSAFVFFVLLILYGMGCLVTGHALNLHEAETFIHYVFSFHLPHVPK